MGTEKINVNDYLHNYYFTKNGYPKKECLAPCDKHAIYLYGDKMKDHTSTQYYKGLMGVKLNQFGNKCIDHHVNFIKPKIKNRVYYGFSQDEEHVNNSLARYQSRSKNAAIKHNVVKKLTNEVLGIEDNKE